MNTRSLLLSLLLASTVLLPASPSSATCYGRPGTDFLQCQEREGREEERELRDQGRERRERDREWRERQHQERTEEQADEIIEKLDRIRRER
jgi:hypothetical protein